MKTLRLFVCLFSIITMETSLFAQKKETIDLLMYKEWSMQFPSEKKEIESLLSFTTKEKIVIPVIGGKRYELRYDYYLSDEIETIFDTSKVGKSKSGKYIVINYKSKSKVGGMKYALMISEIVNLSDTLLQIKSLKTNVIGTYKPR